MNDKDPSAIFDELRGEPLSSVTFVQDYLQISFDGPCINVNNPLTVESATGKITSWQPGFRDLLCAQIAKIVDAVEYRLDDAIVIRFTDGSSISVSLRLENCLYPEAIYAHHFRQ